MALFACAYTPKALASLRTIPRKSRQQITSKIDNLTRNPRPPNSRVVQAMTQDDRKVLRIRSGKYRVLYTVIGGSEREIVILDIGHRKDIYR